MGTRKAWSIAFLQQLGNNGPSDDMIKFVSAWTRVENTKARYNPLATSLEYGRWSCFNYVAGRCLVKNYSTYQEGIEAAAYTLDGNFPGYADLKQALQSNDVALALGNIGLDTWGSGSAKVSTAYAAGGFIDEELLSDTGTSAESNITPEVAEEREEARQQEETEAISNPNLDDAGISIGVSEDDVRNFLKIVLGVTFIGLSLIIIITSVIKTDAMKQAIAIAKVAQ